MISAEVLDPSSEPDERGEVKHVITDSTKEGVVVHIKARDPQHAIDLYVDLKYSIFHRTQWQDD